MKTTATCARKCEETICGSCEVDLLAAAMTPAARNASRAAKCVTTTTAAAACRLARRAGKTASGKTLFEVVDAFRGHATGGHNECAAQERGRLAEAEGRPGHAPHREFITTNWWPVSRSARTSKDEMATR